MQCDFRTLTIAITGSHLSRSAYTYIRQSAHQQVQHNVESNRRQDALREQTGTAIVIGWRVPFTLTIQLN